MSSIAPTPEPPARHRLLPLFPLLLLVLLPLAPPETRGEGMAGAALAVALFTALRSRELARTRLPLALLLGGAVFFPALLLAEAPGAAVEPLAYWVVATAAGGAAATLTLAERRATRLFAGLGAAALLVALHALYQVLWGLEALERALAAAPALADREQVLARLAGGRAFAAFSTPAALGGFLALCLPVTVGLALAARSARARFLWIGAAVLELAGLLATASISAAVALGAAVLVACVRTPALRRRLWIPAVVALLLVAAAVALRGSEIGPSSAVHPLRLRAANWRVALEMIADHPWTGVGPGCFGEVYPRYRRAEDNETRHAHDLPLELAAEWGVPAGLLAAGLFYWVFLGPLLRPHRDDEPPPSRGAAVGLAALALQGLLDFTVLLPSLLWLAAIVRGLLARPPREDVPVLRPALVLLGLASVLGAACVAGLGGLAWNARIAARALAHEGAADPAAALARRASRLAPWNPDGWLYRAQIVGGLAPDPSRTTRYAEARDAAERAVALAPARASARMTRGRLRAAAGDAPGAYADAAAAARLYPLERDYAARRDDLARRIEAALGGPP